MPEPRIMTSKEFKEASTPSNPFKRGRDMHRQLVAVFIANKNANPSRSVAEP